MSSKFIVHFLFSAGMFLIGWGGNVMTGAPHAVPYILAYLAIFFIYGIPIHQDKDTGENTVISNEKRWKYCLGASVLLITHDMGVVAAMAKKVGVIYAGNVVEDAGVVSLFQRSQHPYTWSLLQALPRMDDPGKRIEPLSGSPPDMINLSTECPFLPRCFKAQSKCRSDVKPNLIETEVNHFVACYNPVIPESSD